jgi:inositol transport system ATP-binding protein
VDLNQDYVLEMKNITKIFPGVAALNNVDLKINKGEVHALIGENGAGKSTLMKILIGIYKAEKGEIIYKGEKVNINNPGEALNLGISMIHQELNHIPEMTVAENIFLGREPSVKFFKIVKVKSMKQKTEKLFSDIGIKINPVAKVSSLSVAEMQMVEIVKAVSYNADIIIMDEPTSAITDREVEKLFDIIRALTSKGKAVIYISHKLDEIFKICDKVTVLRDGHYIDTKKISEINKQVLISMMVGREISNIFPKEDVKAGNIILEVRNLSVKGKFSGINFTLRKGEILGIAGLMGAGRTELVEAIFGIRKLDFGEIIINNEKIKITSAKKAILNKIALVSEDRKLFGLNLKASVKNNLSIVNLDSFSYLNFILNLKKERSAADAQIKLFGIKTTGRNQIVNSLSGGNQQKVVIAKWLLITPDIIILDEPTRGIDVGAKSEIHKLMVTLAKEGKSIIMISSELPEILGMSDRVIVLHEGEITGEFSRDELEQEKIMACATGHKKGEKVI